MGKINDLKDKVSKGIATDDEVKELDELLSEAKGIDTDDKSVEKDVDALADKLVEAATTNTKALDEKFDKLLKALEEKAPEGGDQVTKFIVDGAKGKVSVDDLSKEKIVVESRKAAGKQYNELSKASLHFVSALFTGDRQKLQLLTEGTAASGGYVVPEDFANMIVEDKRDQSVMRQLASQITTTTDTLHLPNLNSRPKAAWRSEGAVKATSTATFGENVFTPYSLAVIVGLSQELAADASLGMGGSIVNYVAGLMAQSLREAEDAAFWTANGSGKPTGVNNYSLSGLDAGGTDAALADAIKSLYFNLPQGYRNNAVWVGHQQAIARVAKAKDTTNQYLLQSLSSNPFPTLNGARVYEQNDLPTDILLYGDFSYYYIVDRQGVTVDFSTEATVGGSSAFEKNLTFVRVEERTDGELTLTNAVRKLSGMN